MRSRKAANDQVAEVARRRLELLALELARINGGHVDGALVTGGPVKAAHANGVEAALPTPTGVGQSEAYGEGGPERDVETPGTPPGRHALRPVPRRIRTADWAHDRLPPTLQGRVELTAGHLSVVAVLVALALGATAWWVVRADGAGSAVPRSSSAMVSSAPTPLVDVGSTEVAGGPALPSATPTEPSPAATVPGASGPTQPIVVDVAGKVRKPGIATLPAGSRVADALRAAGGARPGVSLATLNLARVLGDGEQIVVGLPVPAGVAASAASAPVPAPAGSPGSSGSAAAPLVNLNAADQAELESLPGVGPVTAEAIVAWRTEHGTFTAVDELLEVSGIGEAMLTQ
jgi:competence protein ComEA